MSLIFTPEFATALSNLKAVVDSAQTPAAILKALGVGDVASMSPFAVQILGGVAEFNRLSANKEATADSEVLVLSQLGDWVQTVPGFPNLGPNALVSYTGTAIAAPVNPTAAGVYKAVSDADEATGISWQPDETDVDPNVFFRPLRIAIGTFTLNPSAVDFAFSTASQFLQWSLGKRFFEPVTLLMQTGLTPAAGHSFSYPVTTVTSGTGYVAQMQSLPLSVRRSFLGRGRLIIVGCSAAGDDATTETLVFRHLRVRNCPLEFAGAANIEVWRQPDLDLGYGLDIRHSSIRFTGGRRLYVRSTQTAVPVYAEYSANLSRCVIQGSGVLTLVSGPASGTNIRNWGRISGCTIRDVSLSGWAPNKVAGASVTQEFLAELPILGWRLDNCVYRAPALHTWGLDGSSAQQRTPLNYVFVNCRLYITNLILGADTAGTQLLTTFQDTVVYSTLLSYSEADAVPSLIKAVSSKVFAQGLALTGRTTYSGSGVDRAAAGVPGHLMLTASSFGVPQANTPPVGALTDAADFAIEMDPDHSVFYWPAASGAYNAYTLDAANPTPLKIVRL